MLLKHGKNPNLMVDLLLMFTFTGISVFLAFIPIALGKGDKSVLQANKPVIFNSNNNFVIFWGNFLIKPLVGGVSHIYSGLRRVF
jgi:hypothetical protein